MGATPGEIDKRGAPCGGKTAANILCDMLRLARQRDPTSTLCLPACGKGAFAYYYFFMLFPFSTLQRKSGDSDGACFLAKLAWVIPDEMRPNGREHGTKERPACHVSFSLSRCRTGQPSRVYPFTDRSKSGPRNCSIIIFNLALFMLDFDPTMSVSVATQDAEVPDLESTQVVDVQGSGILMRSNHVHVLRTSSSYSHTKYKRHVQFPSQFPGETSPGRLGGSRLVPIP